MSMAPSHRTSALTAKRHAVDDFDLPSSSRQLGGLNSRSASDGGAEDDGSPSLGEMEQKGRGGGGLSHRTLRSSSALLSDSPNVEDEDPLFLHEVLMLLMLEKLGEYPKDREFKFALLVMMVFDLLLQGKIILQRKSIIQGGYSLERNAVVIVDDTKTRSPVLNDVFEIVAQLSTMEAKEMEEILEDLCGLSPNKSNKVSKLKRRLVEYFLSRRVLKQSTTRTRNRLVCLPSVVKTSYMVTNKKCKKYVNDLIARVGYTVAMSHQNSPTQTVLQISPAANSQIDSGPKEGILLDFDDNTFSSSAATTPTTSSHLATTLQTSLASPLSVSNSPAQQRFHMRGNSSDINFTHSQRHQISNLPSAKPDLMVSDTQARRALTIEEHARLLLHRDDMNSQAHVPFVVLMSMPFRNNVLFDTMLLNHGSDARELVGISAAELSSADPVLLELSQATADILHNNRAFFNKKGAHGTVICG